MSTKIVALTVPAAPGFGAHADISDLVGCKTVQLSGTFGGSYVLYVTQDGTSYVPLLSFDAGGPEGIKKTFAGAFRYAKIFSRATDPQGVAASISGLEEVGSNTFAASTLAVGFSGQSPVEDLGVVLYQEDVCGTLSGQFTGEFILEGSLDGVRYNPIGAFKSQGPQSGLLGPARLEWEPYPIVDKVRYLRATLNGVATTALVITVGGSQDTTLNPAEKAALDAVLLDGISGEDFAGVYAIGEKDVAGTVKLFRATAAASAPIKCVGVALTLASAVDVTVSLRTVGLTDSIPDAAWVTAPVAADIGKTAYLAKTAGKSFTLDVSGYLPTDVVQPLGTLEVVATGTSKIRLSIGADVIAAYAVGARRVNLQVGTTYTLVVPTDSVEGGTGMNEFSNANPIAIRLPETTNYGKEYACQWTGVGQPAFVADTANVDVLPATTLKIAAVDKAVSAVPEAGTPGRTVWRLVGSLTA